MSHNLPESPELSTPENIKAILHSALGNIGKLEECALLDYPQHLNIGDHVIWLATIFYLKDILKTKIKYTASLNYFSEQEMEKNVGKAPIIFPGGGNLGDLWPQIQDFKERIIAKYRDRPIIILPQCIYFSQLKTLSKAAAIFNAHPNLTLFTRDNRSYEFALKYFYNCRVINSPDIVFHLVNMPLPSLKFNPKRTILYLCRQDREINQEFSPTALEIPNLVVQDWVAYNWTYRDLGKLVELRKLPGSVNEIVKLLLREGWQRGLAGPLEWISRQRWEHCHPYAENFKDIYNPAMHRFSWSIMHAGLYQLLQNRLVITNRLHGHIICAILGIPHIFLPNAYHKNQSFYETWSNQIVSCKFVKDARELKAAVQELSILSGKSGELLPSDPLTELSSSNSSMLSS
ncbi:MAG: polysaccharide polymerase [Symploca sp. SIO2E9]|nr:polysaccharide polymerase [Symploca sp. SIO2E9]